MLATGEARALALSGSKQDASLYFHIPFCSRKCPYCHFFVLPDKEPLKDQLLEALVIELKEALVKLHDFKIASIYFGGGTPMLFGVERISALLELIRKSPVTIAPLCEVTLEANPEHVTPQLMQGFKSAGINRISLGVQSLDDSSLDILGRTHNAKKALQAIDDTASSGIQNLSIDLMYDLPHQTLDSWQMTLSKLKHLPITHLSLYNLTIEPNTAFFKRKQALKALLPTEELSFSLLQVALLHLEEIGLKRYEISAFAKEGYHACHNSGYWTARPFLGLGPSAFSYWEKKRYRNVAHLGRYAEALKANRSPVDFEEKLSFPDDVKELLAIQLRLLEGVDMQVFEKRAGQIPPSTHQTLQDLQAKGWLTLKDGKATLTASGTLFYDSVAEEII